jgi:serine/threonine protein kinase
LQPWVVVLNAVCCACVQMWGTAEYFAPEVIHQAYGPQADVWALGCVLYEMLCGEQAFPTREGDKKNVYYARICEGKYDLNK